jgi:hypothetical protein
MKVCLLNREKEAKTVGSSTYPTNWTTHLIMLASYPQFNKPKSPTKGFQDSKKTFKLTLTKWLISHTPMPNHLIKETRVTLSLMFYNLTKRIKAKEMARKGT